MGSPVAYASPKKVEQEQVKSDPKRTLLYLGFLVVPLAIYILSLNFFNTSVNVISQLLSVAIVFGSLVGWGIVVAMYEKKNI